MAEAGILGEDDRVELIEGEIIEMSPIGGPHAACVDRLTRLLVIGLGDAAIVRVQNPVHLDQRSEPQPDVSLLRPRADFYASGHPSPEDILLVIEVAESSLEYDRRVKVPLYARQGIPEAWLANLNERHLVAHLDPTPDGYRTMRVFRPGEMVSPSAFPHLEIPVDEILG